MDKRCVLVIDDDKTIRECLKHFFEYLGLQVITYASPAEMPCFVEADLINDFLTHDLRNELTSVDLVITDIEMPHITGIEFIELLSQTDFTRQHIAVMSGAWQEKYTQVVDHLNCKKFSKPLDLKEIDEWLTSL